MSEKSEKGRCMTSSCLVLQNYKKRRKIRSGVSWREAAMEWKPGRSQQAELDGAQWDLELDQQGWPKSCSSVGMGYRSAQGSIVAIEM